MDRLQPVCGRGALVATENSARKSDSERKAVLSRHVIRLIAQGGRVEFQGDYQAVVVLGHRVNHPLHLVLAILTGGLWVIVWIALSAGGGEKRHLVQVDEWGTLTVARL